MAVFADDSAGRRRFHGCVDDDFVFVPTQWDIAMAFALDLEPETRGGALLDLADAMVMWAEGEEAEELTTRAIDAVWSAGLEEQIRAGIARAGEFDDDWRQAAEAAAAEFELAPRQAEVTRAALQQLAWAFGHEDAPPLFCLCCIDEVLARLPQEERRRHAAQAAVLAVRDAAIPDDEVAAALAACAPGRLATNERRVAVRRRLGRLGWFGRESLRSLAAELEQIATEPLPADPALDDVWEVVVHTLLAELAQPALN
jgi:hypothetical protein